jgi:hypothetical protein
MGEKNNDIDYDYKFPVDFLKTFDFNIDDTIDFIAIDKDTIIVINHGSTLKSS